MNSNTMRACGTSKFPHSLMNSIPRSWSRMLLLAVVALLGAASAFAGPSINVGDTGMFRPRGAVRAHVGAVNDIWVTDGASGFCRLDQVPDARFPGRTHGVLNLNTCFLPGVFEPMDYQVETFGVNGSNGYVFVAGIDGVYRIDFVIGADGRTAINGTPLAIFNANSTINGIPVGRIRTPQSAKLGPDGKLYFCLKGSGDIWRINNPLSPSFTVAGNTVERVGTSDNQKTLLSIAWVGHDLWMSQAGFLNRIQNADQCHYQLPKCQAVLQFGKLQTQEGLQSDQFFSTQTDGRWLYWGNGNRVVRFDTQSGNLMQVWNQAGFVNGSAIPQEYTLIMGLNFVQPTNPPMQLIDPVTGLPNGATSEMFVTTDPIIEAPPPAVPGPNQRTGRAWSYAARPSNATECNPASPTPQTCIVSSLIGSDFPPTDSPQHDAARRGVLMLAGITHPRGLLWLQSNFWVSDKVLGFCRVDIVPVAGLSHCFKPSPSFAPGQAAADAPSPLGTQNVYIPDASGTSTGIFRMLFTPDGTGGTISQTGLLNKGPGTVTAIAMPQGPTNEDAIYFGFSDNADIKKIQNPDTAPTGAIVAGHAGNSVGVENLVFKGNDLYLAELGPPPKVSGQLILKGQMTVLKAASPDVQRGNAEPVTRALSRLQSPPRLVLYNPAALVVGPTGDRPSCLPPIGVHLSNGVAGDGTDPALYMGTFGTNAADPNVNPPLAQLPEVDRYDFVCTTQLPWVEEGALDPSLSINAQLGPVTALGFSITASRPISGVAVPPFLPPVSYPANASMAIGDDPSVVVPAATLQRSKFSEPETNQVGQGHIYLVP